MGGGRGEGWIRCEGGGKWKEEESASRRERKAGAGAVWKRERERERGEERWLEMNQVCKALLTKGERVGLYKLKVRIRLMRLCYSDKVISSWYEWSFRSLPTALYSRVEMATKEIAQEKNLLKQVSVT